MPRRVVVSDDDDDEVAPDDDDEPDALAQLLRRAKSTPAGAVLQVGWANAQVNVPVAEGPKAVGHRAWSRPCPHA